MDSLINNSSTLLGITAAIVAIVGGLFGFYKWLNSRPLKKQLSIFSDTDSLKGNLLRLRGRTVNFDTLLDFSVCNEFSNRIATETEYEKILHRPASELNNKPLRLYGPQKGGHLDSFASLVVSVKDSERLKFSHGGTGVIYVLFKGKFEVEARSYAGPTIEFTLREIA